MCKSRLYRNGVHGNEEEENKKKMKKGKNIDDRDPEPLSSRGKKREKERADFKQILADKGEEMYMKMKQRGKGVDNGENHETLADMKRKHEKKGVACLGSHSILSQPNEAEAESSKSASKRVKKERDAILAALFGHSDGGVHISNPRNDVFISDSAIEIARNQVASLVKASPKEIVFTSEWFATCKMPLYFMLSFSYYFDADQNIRPTERISNHRLNDETHQGDSFESGLNPSTKGLTKNSTKRGPDVCNVIPTEKSKRLKVTYNERGQPIHEESKKLVSFLGAQVRLMVDINIDNWKKVSNETKDSLWTVTKQKFVVPESARHITMRELGYLWRSSKSRFSRIIASCANEEERMEKRPKNIKLEWWKSFVRKRLSKEFQEKIQEFRETQAESSSLSLQDDAISQLFGPERRGRVRGYGFGVCPSMLGLIAQNNETVAQLQEVVSVLNEKVASMETLRQDMQHHIIEKREMQEQMKNMQQVMTQLMQSQASGISSFVHANKSPPQPSFEGIECKLFRMDKEDIVAEGTWLTDDPNAICSGVKLGPGACKVWVTNALEPSAKVWKASNGLRTMEQALGFVVILSDENSIFMAWSQAIGPMDSLSLL
ncbi:hypothetical protein IFM89_013605 [Coptis chinensis]|uniref:Transposase Tnp1/En/Spm-like domain-containing protein n=1 Tax=Coptis chinensis TaxID=261450 RepID=A0A835HCI5_9MAGN|nr:hypothetical protein IFM89_013605 [Coptis chinensis]